MKKERKAVGSERAVPKKELPVWKGLVVLTSTSCRQRAFSVFVDTAIVCLIMQGLELGKGPHRHRHNIYLLIKRKEVEENGNKEDYINKKKKSFISEIKGMINILFVFHFINQHSDDPEVLPSLFCINN